MDLPAHPTIGEVVRYEDRAFEWDGIKWMRYPRVGTTVPFESVFWPIAPEEGDVVTDPLGRRWVWDGEKWIGTAWVPTAGPAGPPGPPCPPGPPGEIDEDQINGLITTALDTRLAFYVPRYGLNGPVNLNDNQLQFDVYGYYWIASGNCQLRSMSIWAVNADQIYLNYPALGDGYAVSRGEVAQMIDTALGSLPRQWRQITRAEFDALPSPDPNVLYVIVG